MADGVDTSWLDEGEQRDWRASVVGMTYLLATLSRDLEVATGLSMAEYEILVRLSEAPDGSVRMSDLADGVAHSRSRVTHTVARLEAAGLVSRRPAAEDRRGIAATLTAAGYERLVAAAPSHVASVRARLVDVIDRDQLAQLGEAMRAVLREAALVDAPGESSDTSCGDGAEPCTQEGLRD
ncbi:MarR family winged helix-turn-helix transcriptional regulator [Serinibacter arcticus]|uniref:Transcriptional regulator, MarR family n=1 Tax=Serinibacter arcticus TaxID=1655435 RepID=A0A4Z1EAF2_9MICO|nr:MarR family transcriptional regulator [Serinibacter arcticus]TGO06447.1 Transcriptional regulator, MarR family [Serinibacter arcticus]